MDVLDENIERLRLTVSARMEQLLILPSAGEGLFGSNGLSREDDLSKFQSSAIPMPDTSEALVVDQPNFKWASDSLAEVDVDALHLPVSYKPSMFSQIFSRFVSTFKR